MSEDLIDEEETSAVTDMRSLWGKMDRRTRRMIKGQEDTQEELADVKTEVVRTNTRLDAQSERTTSLEGFIREGHMCQRGEDFRELRDTSRDVLQAIQSLSTDAASTQGVAQRASEDVTRLAGELKDSADNLRQEEAGRAQARSQAKIDRAKEMRGARRTTVSTAVGALLVLVLAAGSSVWYIGHLDERDKQQNDRQDAATTALKTQVGTIETKINKLPTSEQITSLTKEVRLATSEPANSDHEGWFFVKSQSSQRRFCREQRPTQLKLLPPSVLSACRVLRR
jgi:phage shock protein A